MLAEPKRVISARLYSLHELIAGTYRDVEVVDIPLFPLALDELLDIGMVHIHYGHVRTVPLAALSNQLGSLRQVSQRRNWTARLAVGSGNRRILGAQLR